MRIDGLECDVDVDVDVWLLLTQLSDIRNDHKT